MATKILTTSYIPTDFSSNVQILLKDILAEYEEKKTDGILSKLMGNDGSKEELYNFIKNEGYELNYKEFTKFYEASDAIVEKNKEYLVEACYKVNEKYSDELSENDLENVVGGKLSWGKIAIAAGLGLAVGGLVIATGGLAAVAIVGVGVGSTVLSGSVAGVMIVGGVAAVGAGGTAATVGAVSEAVSEG